MTHFTNEDAEAQGRFNNLPQVTDKQLGGGERGEEILPIQLRCPPSHSDAASVWAQALA